MEMKKKILISTVVAQLVIGAINLNASTITVDSLSGSFDRTGCTIRDAIVAANTDKVSAGCIAGSGADTIIIPESISSGTITLTVPHGDSGYGGLPQITSPVTIQGNGVTIKREEDADNFSIFDIRSGADVTLDNMTIENGQSFGGGIIVAGSAAAEEPGDSLVPLTISNSTISGNTGAFGGGISAKYTDLTIENSTISNNTATDAGGAIWSVRNKVSIRDSFITGNTADARGGGIAIHSSYNTDDDKYNSFAIHTEITGNSAEVGGGVFATDANFNLSYTTISGNSAMENEDTDPTAKGGGVYNSGLEQPLVVKYSTLSQNWAEVNGGAIFNEDGNLLVKNSTISGNDTSNSINLGAGGVYNTGEYAQNYIYSSTIIDNTSSASKYDVFNVGTSSELLSIKTTIIGEAGGAAPDTLLDNYIVEIGSSAGSAWGTATGVDPMLLQLADNGGETATRAAMKGSLLFGMLSNNCIWPNDQRGYLRDSPCMIGAYEYKTLVTSDFFDIGQNSLLWHNSDNGQVFLWKMSGFSRIGGASVADSSNTNLIPKGIGDFNGDDIPDILVHNQNTGMARAWTMNSAAERVDNIALLESSNTNLMVAGVGDFDGDGDTDIAVFNGNSGSLLVWVMDGTTKLRNETVLTGANLNLVPQGVGDMDNDGIPDIVLRNDNSGAVRVWSMNSDYTRKGNEKIVDTSNTNLELRGVMDINGDGNSDILNYNTNSGVLRSWIMKGDMTILSNEQVAGPFTLNWSVRN